MDWNDYRKSINNLPFSEDFQERTENLLHRQAQNQIEMERITMKRKGFCRAAIAAAIAAALSVSAYAAARWLAPTQVAEEMNEPDVAQAFRSANAMIINESQETKNFRVTLEGMVSGKGLTGWTEEYIEQDRTYAVVAIENIDGTALNIDGISLSEYTLTPLVAGFTPWSVNNWTLDAGVQGMSKDGIYYYLLDTKSLEMFADHTVYLAFYHGGSPSRDIFTMSEDGSINFVDTFDDARAIFTLPLDAGKANPAAVEKFIRDSGFEPEWFSNISPEDDAFDSKTTEDINGDKQVEIREVPSTIDWITVDESAASLPETNK